jgi:hypothetical protein
MHLMIPCAGATGEASAHAASLLRLPHLSALLGRFSLAESCGSGDEFSLNTPAEHWLAEQRGLQTEDGCLPQAAWRRLAAGGPSSTLPWALLTPIHMSVGSEGVTALDPRLLELAEPESRELFAVLADLFPADEGWQAEWLSPEEWLVAHERFDGLACASLARVINRDVEAWMPQARPLRTLQNEVQMLLHRAAVNETREARGALAVNSVWISGCGRAIDVKPLPPGLQIDTRLEAACMAGDWAAWCEAWQALDAGPLRELLEAARGGRHDIALTLCGERHARSWRPAEQGLAKRFWQRIAPPSADVAAVLETL